MNTTIPLRVLSRPSRRDRQLASANIFGLSSVLFLLSAAGVFAGSPSTTPSPTPARTWPQPYTVERNEAAGVLRLRTAYYTLEQDLKKGGAVSRITLVHGKAPNLLLRPLEFCIRDEQGALLSDLNDAAPSVAHQREGLNEIVTVESVLKDREGRASSFRLKTTLQYHWGFVKIRRELTAPAGARVREVCPLATTVAPSLSGYGYREGITEAEGAPPFSFGSNRWGKLGTVPFGAPSDHALHLQYIPRSMMLLDRGVEGLEWFVGSDLWQWDLQLAGHRGAGRCVLEPTADPVGLRLAVSPLGSPKPAPMPKSSVFDFYVAFPILEGHAHGPWLHTSFNRNRGHWVSAEQIQRWAERGIQTVHCHNDGDYYGDGLFWHDGAYPPYPDMDRYDQVLTECRRVGIRTATYFSNKELHPSTPEFRAHGLEWGRMNRKGELQHNFYKPGKEFGAQMCLRSGWLNYLELAIDRVLKNHPLDGVYYDWNVALLCCNPQHVKNHPGAAAKAHWDIDELVDLMEWTRKRVGPNGMIIVHNTTTPMFATENFADYVVATEWGYGKWTNRAPDPEDLPLEWSLAGAVPRGVISYGTLAPNAPRRLHRLFALEAFLGGVTTWPASDETFQLLPLMKPLGNFADYQFVDWRNQAVSLSHARCASAVYSRPGEAYLLLVNLDDDAHAITCRLHPEKLPHPLTHPTSAATVAANPVPSAGLDSPTAADLNVAQLIGTGLPMTIPGDGAIMIRVR